MKTPAPNHDVSQYVIDPAHTTVAFSVRHLMITTVRGVFDTVSGSVKFGPDALSESSISVEIPVASVNTREPQRDAHLRSADFFDAEHHPSILFRSTSLRAAGEGYEVNGLLTMRGVAREVTLAVSEVTGETRDHNGKLRRGASASTKVRRSEFGVSFNKVLEAGHLAIGDDVTITLDVSLLKVEG